MRHRVRVEAGGDQTGIMGHVHHENGADLLGHFGETLEVDPQSIGRGAGDDQLGLVLVRQPFHLGVVDFLVFVQTVGHHVEPLAGHVERHAVGQVAAGRKVHAEDGVARFEEGHEHRLVGLRAGVRLDIGGIGAEQLFRPIDGQLLGHINMFAAAVIALARIALGVLVGQLRTLGFHHRP